MNNKRKILTIFLLLLVLVLGVTSMFVAYRLGTQRTVAPTAPESEPRAAEPDWINCNDLQFTIACQPRPACLDNKTNPCTTPEPSGGWCPYLTCANKKKIAYRNDPRNQPGVYYLETALPDGGTLHPGDLFVISIPYKNEQSGMVESATITDTLDPRYTFVDSIPECSRTTADGKEIITCTAGEVAPGGESAATFRVRVKSNAQLGQISNTATMTTNKNSVSRCYNQLEIKQQPTVDLECNSKVAITGAGIQPATTAPVEVTRGQTFTYSMEIENKGNAAANGYEIRDVLKGEGRAELGFVSSPDCKFDTTSRLVNCPVSLGAGQKKSYSFNVIVRQSTADGTAIKNTASVFLLPFQGRWL